MATPLLQRDSDMDETVPANDVTDGVSTLASLDKPKAANAAIEIAGRAAWLAWQIDAEEVNLDEARYQLSGIGEDLGRYKERLPAHLISRVMADYSAARSASQNKDLAGMSAATRQIRLTMEQFHKATLG
jgi:hypothetical protein